MNDVTYAARTLLSAKKFAAIVVATLALGVGANAAVFAVLNAVVLQPLPYEEPSRLVRIYQRYGTEDGYLAGAMLLELRNGSKTLDVAAVYTYRAEGVDLTDRAQPERVRMLPVSAEYFRVLGVRPIAGRVFARDDERPDARVAVVSERIWREYLGGTFDAAGQFLSLNGVRYQVAAVLPDRFEDPLQPGVDVWTPVDFRTSSRISWGNHYISAIGRLQPGATLQQAQAELAATAARAQPNYGKSSAPVSANVVPLQVDTVGSAGRMLWILFGAVGLLLVIACVNVAGVILARSAARESELAIRAALGCSRWRLARQLVIESVMLALAGGAAGLVLAQVVTRVLLAAAPESVTHMSGTASGGTVFGFGFAVAVISGMACGLIPALQFARPNLESVLRESSRSASSSRRQIRLRNVLVTCQIALALILLIGAGLLLRTFQRLSSISLGFEPADVLTFEVHLPEGRYAEPERRAVFHVELERRLAAIPGVRASGAVSRLPVTGPYHSWGTRRLDVPGRSPGAQQRAIEGEYFKAMGIPLVSGRVFGPEDDAKAPRRVIVSRALVKNVFGAEDPLGKRLLINDEPVEIIGIVGDVPVTARGGALPIVYHSHTQFAGNRNWALIQVVAVERPVPTLLADVRRELAAIDPALVLYQPRMLTDVIGRGVAQERFALMVIGAYALLALALAAVGIYGVLSYAVSRRRRELGIRLALGAQTSSIRALVVRDGGTLAVAGVAIGLIGAFFFTRTLGSMLFEVRATEPAVFAAAAAAILVVALAASWIPARTATKVDALHALRSDA
jgi:predicted permease